MISLKKMKRKKNQGNSFIMVIATLSFLAVLVAAILVAVALCYRLKAYDVNARDNFYYLEQAMDEIYAGIGGDAMTHLNQAYDDTLEVMVFYDTTTKSYTTMDNDEANKIMKSTYMSLLKKDVNYASVDAIKNRLNSFLSYPYDDSSDSGKEGVQLQVGNLITSEEDEVMITNLVLKREAKYSTVNARSQKDAEASGKSVGAADTFIQSITTDIVIAKPEFNVNFNTIASDLNVLYGFSIVSDMGVEITGKDGKSALGNDVSITGNVYAASDFYNKSYKENTVLNSYNEEQLKKFNGVDMNSMYSGFYIDGATVVISADRLIVPGTIAAINCADVTIYGMDSSKSNLADVWADGIVLDGYALKQNVAGTTLKGATLNMKAKAYIYDDLEVNANSASVLLNGEYYGYNYASTDNRTYTDACLKDNKRVYSTYVDKGITDGQDIAGQAHYNSSAIILNGENTSLDFSLVEAMYIAGQSYIEVSKDTKKSETTETIQYTVSNDGSGTQVIEDQVQKEYDTYVQQDDKNYTVDNSTGKNTVVEDYRTGEAISIKSNQLAYIPNWSVTDNETGLYVSLPEALRDVEAYQDIWADFDKIPVIKTVLSGKTYYFLDFSQSTLQEDVMNQFIEDYAALFDETTAADGSDTMTTGEAYGLVDITDYDYFQVKMLKLSSETGTDAYSNIYTNSAITTKVDNTFTIKASSKNEGPLKQAIVNMDAAKGISTDKTTLSTTSSQVTTRLQNSYKEVKYLLTNESSNGTYVSEAQGLKESEISPILHYFDFSKIIKDTYCALDSGYGVWVSQGDVHIGATSCKVNSTDTTYSTSFKNGKVRGVIIAKGTVTFDDDVKEFEGLIVTGGKVIVNNFTGTKNTMSFLANAEIVKNVLRDCDASRGQTASKDFSFVCDIFALFESQYQTSSTETSVESMKNISAVQFEDILSYRNWKKNVD